MEPTPEKKPRKKRGATRPKLPPEKKSHLIQARLHPNNPLDPQEASALEVYWYLTSGGYDGKEYTDREVVKQALIALGASLDSSWQPLPASSGQITAEVMNMLREMMGVITQLSAMDFSSVRMTDGSQISDAFRDQVAGVNQQFQAGFSDLIGNAVFADIDDDE